MIDEPKIWNLIVKSILYWPTSRSRKSNKQFKWKKINKYPNKCGFLSV